MAEAAEKVAATYFSRNSDKKSQNAFGEKEKKMYSNTKKNLEVHHNKHPFPVNLSFKVNSNIYVF